MSDDIRSAHRTRAEFTQTEAHFDKVRQAIIEQWVNTGFADGLLREKLHMGVQVLDALKKSMLDEISTLQIDAYAQKVVAGAFSENPK